MTKDEALSAKHEGATTVALKLALEAFEYIENNYMSLPAPATKAITAIREALAQPEGCQCFACKIAPHASDCAVHNEPAYPKNACDCGAQPEQEPVAWFEHNPDLDAWFLAYSKNQNPGIKSRSLVFGDTAPPQRKPLSDEQWQVIADTLDCLITRKQKDAIEAVIGIKE